MSPTARIASVPCLVLLGEPGLGKSSEVERAARAGLSAGRAKHVDLGSYSSEDRLLHDVFDDGEISRWTADGEPFERFFDSVDESLPLVSTFARNLIVRLRALPRDRARVRIVCRTADWPSSFDLALRELYPGDAFGIWELLPLRRRDCVEAARTTGVSAPEKFVSDIVASEVQTLAIKPLTLDMLLRTSDGGSLPTSRTDLFEKAALLLATKPNDVYPKPAQNLTPVQRLAVAQRIAGGTILCGTPIIARDGSHHGLGVLALEEAAGGTERVGETTVDVDASALAETIRTGLFSGAGPGRLGWYHHAVAEFLLARWLVTASLHPRQTDFLLFHSGDPRRVVPQLREVAAWVAVYDARVLKRIAANEPELLRADAPSLHDEGRADLVDGLLRRLDALEAHDFGFGLRARYATLKHQGLADQLRPVIVDRSKNPMVRRVAIDLAEACGLVELEGLLVSVALDSEDTSGTRQQPLAEVGKIGSSAARRHLRRLVTEDAPEAVDDGLRGYALHTLWPDHMTRAELLAALRVPRVPMHYGGYASLITSLAQRLRDEDVADALDWAATRVAGVPLIREKKTIDEIVGKALPLLNEPP